MSTTIGTLIIDLRANTASFVSEMGKASQISAKTANDVKRSLEKIGAAAVGMGAAVAAATLGIVRSALDSTVALDKTAQAAGTTAESLSRLQYAASLADIGNDELGSGLEKLSRAMFGAQNGNIELQRLFQRLGISVVDSNGKLRDSGAVMGEVSKKFSQMGDSAGKTAEAQLLFGKSGAALIPFLNEYGEKQAEINAEAEKFGVIVGGQFTAASAAAQENLKKLEAVLHGIELSVLQAVLPAMTAMSDKLLDLAKNGNLMDLAKSFGSDVADSIRVVGSAFQFAADHAHALKLAIEALAALQVANIAIPFLAEISKGTLTAGIVKFTTSMLGVSKLAPILEKLAGKLQYAIQFTRLLAAEEGIAAAASYVFGGALAVLTSPIAVTVGALAIAGGALYAFRNRTFEVRGEIYKLSDAYKALWQILTFTNKTGERSVTQIIQRIRGERLAAYADELSATAGAMGAGPNPGGIKPPPDTGGLKPQKDPYQDEINKLNQAIASNRAYIAVLGESQDKINAVAAAEKAHALIVDLNNRLTDSGRAALTAKQKATLEEKVALDESLKALDEYGKSLNEQSRAAGLSITQTTALTTAVFNGEEATRAASAQNEILGLTYNKTKDQLSAMETTLQKLGAALKEKLDAESLKAFADSIYQEQRSAELAIPAAQRLAAANLQGEAAVRQATIENALAALQYGKTTEQIKAMQPELEKLRSLITQNQGISSTESTNKEIYALQQELVERRIQIAAITQSTEAQREAALQAQTYALSVQIAGTADGAEKDALVAKKKAIEDLTRAEWAETDVRDALALRSPMEQYKQEIDNLNRQASALAAAQGGTLTYGQAMQVAAKAQGEFNKSVDDTVNLLLKSGSAKDGVTAFFLDMQKQAKTAGSILYDALNSGVDKVSENLTKFITTGKADWAKMFSDIGSQMLNSSIKSVIHTGLGALGGLLGVQLTKADGSQASPFYVIDVGGGGIIPGAGGGGGALGGILGKLLGVGKPSGSMFDPIFVTPAPFGGGGLLGGLMGGLGGLMGGLAGGGGDGLIPDVSSTISYGGGFASGGDISPDKAYLVGEQGPEILAGVGGSITNNSSSRRMLEGGGGDTHNYTIDARGTDPVLTEQRVRQAIMASHQSAVTKSIQGTVEMRKRSPSR